jgi:tetratricopeptide (TPR) repeat protein
VTNPARMKSRLGVGLAGAVLAVLLAAYANHFQNGFQFDDAHTVVNNTAIRELRNIPLFFRDATTFSSLPSNQSYRPLVSTLLAVDYHFAGGLHPFWFHLSIFVLFWALCVLLAFVIYGLLQTVTPSSRNIWIAFTAAAFYGVHPANADTVNYVIASAEILSTLGVLASFALYLQFPKQRRYYIYAVPSALAILAKPPAAIFAVLFAVYRLLFRLSDAPPDAKRPGRRLFPWCSEVVPVFALCAAGLFLVQRMTPRTWIAGSSSAHQYLITQPYVALLYFKTFFWPRGLSADYDLDAFVSMNDPRFWAGLVFVIFFVTISIAASFYKPTRVISFGLLWFLIALLPTSLLPLAEVMNDHRTFLPYIGLVIAVAGGASIFLARFDLSGATSKLALVSLALLVVGGSAFATFQRNKAWKNDETLWRDVTIKSPKNGRGLMNYGNTLMAKGDFPGALDYYHRALVLTPQYPFLLINLAIAEDGTHQTQMAEQHFREALRLAPSSPDGYAYYARFLIDHARPDQARGLLERAVALSPSDALARDLLAQVRSPTPESLLALSLQDYRASRYVDCIAAGRAALALRPNYAEAWNNIGAAYNQLGQFKEAAAACEEAVRYKPDFELARNNLQYARAQLERAGK